MPPLEVSLLGGGFTFFTGLSLLTSLALIEDNELLPCGDSGDFGEIGGAMGGCGGAMGGGGAAIGGGGTALMRVPDTVGAS